ncbi:MAG: bifunctional nuclease family protein [Bacteroidales bacterium]|nr:bifunctional nuclease family protein [Bacteroidales bacterium]MBR3427561.1 bifunctional nuclease family protein [Bacteroidales bacterium]
MNKVSLEIIGMTYSESTTGAYVLILGDKNSNRRLPVVIGGNEAQSIALGLERQKSARPLTHDLFLKFADTFHIKILEVVINRFRDGVYYAMLVCQQGNELVMIDARPSDAIALAVRLNCDIYAYESVMEEAGIVMEDTEKETNLQNTEDTSINKVPPTTSLDLIPLDELEDLLQEAIDDEDYQKAAQIRDEINKRK